MIRSLIDENSEKKLFTVGSNATVLDALKSMAESETGSVLVSDQGKIVGIFTERDYARNVEIKGLKAAETKVSDLMTKNMVVIGPTESIQTALNLMQKFHIRHLPIIEDGVVLGVVSLRRLTEALLAEHKETIVSLENYIMGTGYQS
ncbi:MAG TPA: CBS domain-containing protein [Anaerolineales bacterium]|nr:CBS domain-containing protein [Anaerolineales bacterium]